jgi:hypothetical protein
LITIGTQRTDRGIADFSDSESKIIHLPMHVHHGDRGASLEPHELGRTTRLRETLAATP